MNTERTGDEANAGDGMLIDCAQCAMRETQACRDCVVTFILGATGGPVQLRQEESTALDNLAAAGLVPRLRLVPRGDGEAATG